MRGGAGRFKYCNARTPTEDVLIAVWVELLRREQVGIDENFFELGGHSLLATGVVARLREILGVEVPLIDIFEAPTIGELGKRIEKLVSTSALPDLRPYPRPQQIPLSYAQERLWFLEQMGISRNAYTVPLALHLQGPLNVAAMRRTLFELVIRHESLRTRFEIMDGKPIQIVDPPYEPLSYAIHQYRDTEGDPSALQEAVKAYVAEPFDLERGPLFRARLFQRSPDRHILLLVVHHIVSDGWSQRVMSYECGVLYNAFARGQPSPLPALWIQYADYALWQRGCADVPECERQLAYWRKQLRGAPDGIALPTDRPRPPVACFNGTRFRFTFSRDLTLRVLTLAQTEAATLYMVLLAAFQTVLSRWSGQTDLVVGSPVAGRTHQQLEGMIGFFVNALPVRSDLSGNPAFTELLGRVRETALRAYANQDVPFEAVVAELAPTRELSRQPVFQVVFALQNFPEPIFESEQLSIRSEMLDTETAKFELSVLVKEVHGELQGVVEYSTDLFDRATMDRMVRHLERTLEQVVEEPRTRIDELDLLTADERRCLLTVWASGTPGDPGKSWYVHDRFSSVAAGAPGATALVDGGCRVSYAELDRRSNRLARYLKARGIGPEVVVALLLERSVDMIVAMLGVLKAGGAYLPLDPEHPQERHKAVLRSARAPILISHSSLRSKDIAGGSATVLIDAQWCEIERESDEPAESGVSSGNLAYLIYTSGSTGNPKGVLLHHGGLRNLVIAQIEVLGLDADSRVLQFARLSFDAATWEIFGALLAGATLYLAPNERLYPGEDLARTIEEYRIDTMTLPPSALPALSRYELESLRTLVIAGEACSTETARQWSGRCRLINAYGPTETTVCASSALIDVSTVGVPIGRAITNTWLFVLDDRLEPVPIGVAGELFIGGAGIARGYMHQPGLTAQCFLPNPFSGPGERMYRTGDQVRWRPDGQLEFIGRRDRQAKVRGHRIELGEVEAALTRHPDVAQAVVIVSSETDRGVKDGLEAAAGQAAIDQRIVAYVAKSADRAPTPESLRAHLEATLPHYMLPSAYVILNRLPLTENGKVDRKGLPRPEWRGGLTYVAPRTAAEGAVASIWSEVLRVERVGINDTFFEMGGHSLLLIRALQTMRALQIDGLDAQAITIVDLFRYPTIADLVAHFGRSAASPVGPQRLPARRLRAQRHVRANTGSRQISSHDHE